MGHSEHCDKLENEHALRGITHYNLPPELSADCDCECHAGKEWDAASMLSDLPER